MISNWQVNDQFFGKDVDALLCRMVYDKRKKVVYGDRHNLPIGVLSPEAIFIEEGILFTGKLVETFVPCDGCPKLCLDCRMNPSEDNKDEPVIFALNPKCKGYH